MLVVLSGVVALLVLLWMFHDFIWTPPPSVERQLGKPDQPIEYNLKLDVSQPYNSNFNGSRISIHKQGFREAIPLDGS